MPSDKYREDANLIPGDVRFQHVALSVAGQVATGLPDLVSWPDAALGKEPVEIADLNGNPLFFDYPIQKGEEVLGAVRASASKITGSVVVSLMLGPPGWNREASARKAAALVKKQNPGSKISGPKLVCYSYPKLGFLFEVQTGQEASRRIVLDGPSLEVVPELAKDDNREGTFAWSYYDSLADDDRKTRLRRFNQVEKARLDYSPAVLKKLQTVRKISSIIDAAEITIIKPVTKTLPFCNHYATTESRGHHCFVLQCQQVSDYCAVATCQMILCYYRYYYSQDAIAPALGYSPGGGCPSDQSPGYETLTNNHLEATYDTAPTWQKARDQIDALHPFKTGIPGHARACAGYYKSAFVFNSPQIYVYDPWPWNADYKVGGAIAWENWDSVTHTNFIYTQIQM